MNLIGGHFSQTSANFPAMLTVYNEESFREVQVVRSCSVLAPGLFAQSGPMCWLGTTGDTKHGFRVFFLFFLRFFRFFWKKNRDGNVPLRKQRCNVYWFLQVPDTSCFPKGYMLSPRFAQKNRKYKNKKKTAEKEPWAEEAPYPWVKI